MVHKNISFIDSKLLQSFDEKFVVQNGDNFGVLGEQQSKDIWILYLLSWVQFKLGNGH